MPRGLGFAWLYTPHSAVEGRGLCNCLGGLGYATFLSGVVVEENGGAYGARRSRVECLAV